MERIEKKLRARLARAKGGHRKVIQRKLDAITVNELVVETPVPTPVVKKKAAKKISPKPGAKKK
jgi:hypothetical protein